MIVHKSKVFWIAGCIFTLTFAVLFTIRLGIIESILSRPQTLSIESIHAVSERETWMNIFQNEGKIGFSHSRLFKEPTGFRLTEAVQMRINTMGMIQDINLNTETRLNPDFTLRELDFEISSGRFRFGVRGSVNGNILQATTESAGSSRSLEIPLNDKPYHFGSIIDAVAATGLKPGERYVFNIFDPASMGQADVIAEVMGQEIISSSSGADELATKVSLNFKGVSQLAWIGKKGDVVREKGLLGISLVKTDRKDALDGLAVGSVQDLTRAASVASNILLENAEALQVLKIKIEGIPPQNLQLHGGRQTFKGQVLTVEKEKLTDLAPELPPQNLTALEKIFLRPSPFIQSDHQKIQDLAKEVLGDDPAPPLIRARKLVDWVYIHIEKRPVLSLPDALSTLENRVGDCNEHAVLLAALARAAGIPTRLEAGLVYLKGRFYYHAWNLMYLGKWVTADAVFGQLPADVSHLRLVTGSSEQQLDLMGVIGKIRLTVIK